MGNQVAVDDLLTATLWNASVTEWNQSGTAPTDPATGEVYLNTANSQFVVDRYNSASWDNMTITRSVANNSWLIGTGVLNNDGTASEGLSFDSSNNATFSEKLTAGGILNVQKKLDLDNAGTLTIATGVITVTGAFHLVDTEASAASDDLDTINGGNTGDFLIIEANNSGRTVVLKHGTGNIMLDGAADKSLDDVADLIGLFYNGSNWTQMFFSNNA